MQGPRGWAGPETCVPVTLCKCDSLLMAGHWLCSNGCRWGPDLRCDRSGREGHFNNSATTGGRAAFNDNKEQILHCDFEEGRRRRRESESPTSRGQSVLNMKLFASLCHILEISQYWRQKSGI